MHSGLANSVNNGTGLSLAERIGFNRRINTGKQGKTMGDLGIWGLIHLAVVIYAAIQIWGSSEEQVKKIIWIAAVAIFPLVGLIVWFLIGPGTPKK